MKRLPRVLSTLVFLFAGANAIAQEGEGSAPAVVENRLFPTAGRFEVALSGGGSMNNKLNEHYGAVLTLNYNFNEWLSVELLGVGGLGRRTNLATDVRNGALSRWKDDIKSDEFSDNGLLQGSGQLGVRVEPVYGKLSLASEYVLHFRAFVSVGVGMARVQDTSLVFCERFNSNRCEGYRDRTTANPLIEGELGPNRFAFNLGGGMRLFFTRWFALRVEVRDVVFQDAFLKEINPKVVKTGARSGKPDSSPGVTHVALLMGGFSFVF